MEKLWERIDGIGTEITSLIEKYEGNNDLISDLLSLKNSIIELKVAILGEINKRLNLESKEVHG